MGKDQDKLFLPLGQEVLGKTALLTASQSQLDDLYVLCPNISVSKWVTAEIDCHHVVGVEHTEYGQSESIKIGVQQASRDGARAVMIILADQPFVTLEWINRLIAEFEKGDTDFVASLFDDHPCPPALFSQRLFPDLLQLKGDRGARSIFMEKKHRGRFLRCDDPKLVFDVDTQEDYRKAWNHLVHGQS